MKLLNKNECQESFVSKAFKGIVINYNLPQAQHQMYMACTPPTFGWGGGGGAGGVNILEKPLLGGSKFWNTLF